MIQKNPLVSVIVPCYNHQHYVEECLRSVFKQSYTNFELIVIDDGSKDDSPNIIDKLQQEFQFSFVKQQNIGLSATLNKAITQYAKGDYIAILASDDYWHPKKLQKQVDFIFRNEQYAMIYSSAFIVNNNSEIVSQFEHQRLTIEPNFENIILNRAGIPALTALIKREIFDKVGLFDEKLAMEDWDMWLRISYQHKIGYLPEKLAYYRMHDSNISSKLALMLQNRLAIVDKWKVKKNDSYQKAIAYWQLYGLKVLRKKSDKIDNFYLKPTYNNKFNLRYYFYRLKYQLKH